MSRAPPESLLPADNAAHHFYQPLTVEVAPLQPPLADAPPTENKYAQATLMPSMAPSQFFLDIDGLRIHVWRSVAAKPGGKCAGRCALGATSSRV